MKIAVMVRSPHSKRRALDEARHDEGEGQHGERQFPGHLVALDERVEALSACHPDPPLGCRTVQVDRAWTGGCQRPRL